MNSNPNAYSEKELALIKALSPHWYNLVMEGTDIPAPNIYRILIEDAFVNDKTGPAVESLRRIGKSLLQECKIYRCTKEFDDLIRL